MTSFCLTVESLSLPYADDIDTLVVEGVDPQAEILNKEVPDWKALIYDSVVEAKKYAERIAEQACPIVWLLPAWLYFPERKKLFAECFYEAFGAPVSNLIFHGTSSADAAIELALANDWQSVELVAIDASFRVNQQCKFVYQGIGSLHARLTFNSTGWSQQYHELVPSVDVENHNAHGGILNRLTQVLNDDNVDVVVSSGNGVEATSEAWLDSIQTINNNFSAQTRYHFPQYNHGKIGALSGLVNLYSLSVNPLIPREKDVNVLVFSHEQGVNQAVTLYQWKGEESVLNG